MGFDMVADDGMTLREPPLAFLIEPAALRWRESCATVESTLHAFDRSPALNF